VFENSLPQNVMFFEIMFSISPSGHQLAANPFLDKHKSHVLDDISINSHSFPRDHHEISHEIHIVLWISPIFWWAKKLNRSSTPPIPPVKRPHLAMLKALPEPDA
jgi:hypothetical protein